VGRAQPRRGPATHGNRRGPHGAGRRPRGCVRGEQDWAGGADMRTRQGSRRTHDLCEAVSGPRVGRGLECWKTLGAEGGARPGTHPRRSPAVRGRGGLNPRREGKTGARPGQRGLQRGTNKRGADWGTQGKRSGAAANRRRNTRARGGARAPGDGAQPARPACRGPAAEGARHREPPTQAHASCGLLLGWRPAHALEN